MPDKLDNSTPRRDSGLGSDSNTIEGKAPSTITGKAPTHGHYEESPNFGPKHHSDAALLRNPLAGMSPADVLADVDAFVDEKGLQAYRDEFHKGALLARVAMRPTGFESIPDSSLPEDDKVVLREEITHRWRQPFMLYFLVVLCAGSAIVQGMDQTAVNGAQQFYFDEFGIGEDEVYIRGLLNGAPYLCSAVIGCWTNAPLNRLFGRRGTIFISCFISFVASFWMAAADTWYNLLIARFVLGLAVGAKSSTTPVYAAESAPKTIRGALTMMWQMWTAFGIVSRNARLKTLTTDARVYRVCRVPGRDCSRGAIRQSPAVSAVAVDAGVDGDSPNVRHGPGLLLPRVAAVVHGKGQVCKGVQVV